MRTEVDIWNEIFHLRYYRGKPIKNLEPVVLEKIKALEVEMEEAQKLRMDAIEKNIKKEQKVLDLCLSSHERLHRYFMDKGLLDEQATYLVNRISNRMRKKNCIDNFRVSVNGTNDLEYALQQSQGCCGCWDEEVTLRDGQRVKFGFNYGH